MVCNSSEVNTILLSYLNFTKLFKFFLRETNLKCKQCIPETAEFGSNHAEIGTFNGEIVCEPPNNQLNKFEGTLFWKDET